MLDIKISVIVPVYNVEMYIEDCLNSLLEQTETIDEIIIVDDGSIDESYKKCKKIASERDNIKLIHQENKGQGAARNLGMRMTQADYIIFVDSDDMLNKNAVSKIKNCLQNNSIDMLCYDADTLMECDYPLKKYLYNRSAVLDSKIISGKELFSRLYPLNYTTSACLAAYRRKFLLENQILFPEGIFHEDDVFSFKVMMLAESVKYLKQELYIRRYRENSVMTSGWSYKRWEGIYKGYLEICCFLRDKRELIAVSGIQETILALLYTNLKKIFDISKTISEIDGSLNKEIIINIFLETCQTFKTELEDSFVKLKSQLYLINLIRENKINCEKEHIINLLNNSFAIEKKYNRLVAEKIKPLPFRSREMRVGIYGIGKHTQELLGRYEELIGNIESDYFFIDSYITEENAEYCGRPLLNIDNVKGKADIIIISSFIFQRMINEKIDEALGRDFKRINLYNNNDFISYFG
ncbi:glycosyltransferase family 2 protein [Kineothrix sp. MB12-C1]|uniref:glycosyltransferase family 2 protein n=1 Tax=Kineothrix sp. MB12-C1 TaxID=3070215 RepID=UPI0027D220DA|nr:glycosyltransferase [Kineothrix sp. MB12-C1]WMC93865.1 glycosyltransferase [Kineothrix sp. MB12-C1]